MASGAIYRISTTGLFARLAVRDWAGTALIGRFASAGGSLTGMFDPPTLTDSQSLQQIPCDLDAHHSPALVGVACPSNPQHRRFLHCHPPFTCPKVRLDVQASAHTPSSSTIHNNFHSRAYCVFDSDVVVAFSFFLDFPLVIGRFVLRDGGITIILLARSIRLEASTSISAEYFHLSAHRVPPGEGANNYRECEGTRKSYSAWCAQYRGRSSLEWCFDVVIGCTSCAKLVGSQQLRIHLQLRFSLLRWPWP